MAKKMDKTMIIVIAVVGAMGLLSGILGFSAEGTKLNEYTIYVVGDFCVYPQNPASALSICAIVFLLMAQITITAVSGCCGCCKSRGIPSENKRTVGIICGVASWIASGIAWVMLVLGAEWKAPNVERETAPVCYWLKDGILAGAGLLSLAATALGITSYVMLHGQPAEEQAASGAANKSAAGGIAMGHPMYPPQGHAQV